MQKNTLEVIQLLGALLGDESPKNSKGKFIGEEVLVRTYSAGVHVGTLIEKKERTALLENTRRIWNWIGGGLSLSEISQNGMKGGKTSIQIPLNQIEQVEEIIPTTEKARKTFEKYEYED